MQVLGFCSKGADFITLNIGAMSTRKRKKLKRLMIVEGNMKLYLAHPFDSRAVIRKWELRFEERTGIELLNPFYDADGRTDIEMIDAGRAERYEKLVPGELVKRDLIHIHQSDGMVAIVDGSLSYGTIMEIVYGNLFHSREAIHIVVTNGHEHHPWLVAHAGRIYTSFEGFEKGIVHG